MFISPATNTEDEAAQQGKRTRRKRLLLAGFIAAGIVLSACGSDDDTADAGAAETDTAEATTPAASGDLVSTGSTDLGSVLVDEAGLSLYGFLPDELGAPTCGGACADAWPPLTAPSAELPDGLDSGIFTVVDGIDGGFQLAAGGWPLYRFAGDATAGDITGQGSGGSWFLVGPDGSLISDESAAPAPAAAEAELDGDDY